MVSEERDEQQFFTSDDQLKSGDSLGKIASVTAPECLSTYTSTPYPSLYTYTSKNVCTYNNTAPGARIDA